ncbi:MAG: DUF4147 domain-containing protein [Gammaproteobacteria bacterium]|jgi:hydroxypyruvate reductase
MRQQLLELFHIALDAVHGQHAVHDYLQSGTSIQSDCIVVAIGKAAQAMASGCESALGENLVKGLLITKYHHAKPEELSDRWQIIESAHPIPDQQSLVAGQALLDFIQDEEHQHYPVLFLLSGGTSSLVEVLSHKHSHDVLQQVNTWLMASGLAIDQVNQIRKSLSQIKGGKLLHHLQNREVYALLISDVPGDHPHIIGSGLLFPYHGHYTEIDIPEWLAELIPGSDRTSNLADNYTVSHAVIASNRLAIESIKQAVEQADESTVYIHDEFLEGDATDRGRQLASYLVKDARPGIHIWGGETTVTLPDRPGRGGRNQHLALSAAIELKNNPHITLLAAGTDGTDGPTEDAGAIVDGGTLSRGELAGLDPERCLSNADSGSFLEASGDLISTGPTGTNVMDLVIAVKTG